MRPRPVLDLGFQVADHLADDFAQIDLLELAGAGGHAGEREQALDPLLHLVVSLCMRLTQSLAELCSSMSLHFISKRSPKGCGILRSGSCRSCEAT